MLDLRLVFKRPDFLYSVLPHLSLSAVAAVTVAAVASALAATHIVVRPSPLVLTGASPKVLIVVSIVSVAVTEVSYDAPQCNATHSCANHNAVRRTEISPSEKEASHMNAYPIPGPDSSSRF